MSQDKWNESTTDDDQPIVEWFECIYAKLREITGINDGPTIECVDDYQNLLDLIWTTFSNGDPTFMTGMTHSWFDRWLWTPLYDHERDQPYPNLIAIYVRCTRTHQWFRLLLDGPDIEHLDFQYLTKKEYTYALYPVNWRSVVQQQWHV